MCPRDQNSWCKYHLDVLNNTNSYKDHISLSVDIFETLKPVFQDLSADDLLKKCLHGKTQNANEALNAIIWKCCPKNIFVSKSTIEIGVNSAVIEFNMGSNGILSVLSEFGLNGFVTTSKVKKKNVLCKKQLSRKSSDTFKKRRKILKTIKKGFSDKEKDKGKPSYVAGGF